jgi:hypothetical protein
MAGDACVEFLQFDFDFFPPPICVSRREMKTNWVMNLSDEKHEADMRTNRFLYFPLKALEIVERVTPRKFDLFNHTRNNKINNFLLTLFSFSSTLSGKNLI